MVVTCGVHIQTSAYDFCLPSCVLLCDLYPHSIQSGGLHIRKQCSNTRFTSSILPPPLRSFSPLHAPYSSTTAPDIKKENTYTMAQQRDWIHVVKKQRYAIITLQREPVNTMNLQFWEQLTSILDDLEADRTMDGIIFTSGLKRDVFTAGECTTPNS